jgi:multidrug efflux pump subunit AcrB
MADDIAKQLQTLAELNGKIKRLIGLLGSKDENKAMRNELTSIIDDAKTLAAQIKSSIGKAGAQARKDVRFEKLSRLYAKEMKVLSESAQIFAQKERRTTVSIRRMSSHAELGRKSMVKQQQQKSEDINLTVLTSEVAELEEREEQLRHIEQDVRQLNELFKDAAFLVEAQQEHIDVLVDNTSKAKDNVQDAYVELQGASEYQRKSRSKLCIVLVLGLLVVGGLVLGLVFGLGK